MMKTIIKSKYEKPEDRIICHHGNCLEFLPLVPDNSIQLHITSPPYNTGKEYEKKTSLDEYMHQQTIVLVESVRTLKDGGSLCWQVGNHITKDGEVIPLDYLFYPVIKNLNLRMRNRIVWRFGHGLHCKKRFSGRYEVIIWFTKGDDYVFNLDPVRIPQKYPGKRSYKNNSQGKLSGNVLGKNPEDVWDIPNVKSNHVEKTIHPCQFPIGLVERLVLSMTNEGDIVYDPYMGVGSSLCAAVKHKRRAWGSDIMEQYVTVAKERIGQAADGTLPIRDMNKPVYQPAGGKLVQLPQEFRDARNAK